jgi:CBS domain-containing protein
MKVREVMSANPICCVPGDTAQHVAQAMRENNIGSMPVVVDQQSRKLLGMITDRDLCCAVIAEGLDPRRTTIEKFVTVNPVVCRDGENIDRCEQAMQERRVRRIPVVDGEGTCIGIVAQADVALKDKAERVSKTIAEISRPRKAA